MRSLPLITRSAAGVRGRASTALPISGTGAFSGSGVSVFGELEAGEGLLEVDRTSVDPFIVGPLSNLSAENRTANARLLCCSNGRASQSVEAERHRLRLRRRRRVGDLNFVFGGDLLLALKDVAGDVLKLLEVAGARLYCLARLGETVDLEYSRKRL